MWDHMEHSWVSIIDWELCAWNLCNNQEIKTPFQDAALSTPTSVYLHCEKQFTCSLIFVSFKYSHVYLSLAIIFILLIFALSKNKPFLLLCGSFLMTLWSGDMSLQITCLEGYCVEFTEINHAVTSPPRLRHHTRGTIQLAAPDCQLRHSSSLCMCCCPIVKQSNVGSCESPSTDLVCRRSAAMDLTLLPHLKWRTLTNSWGTRTSTGQHRLSAWQTLNFLSLTHLGLVDTVRNSILLHISL